MIGDKKKTIRDYIVEIMTKYDLPINRHVLYFLLIYEFRLAFNEQSVETELTKMQREKIIEQASVGKRPFSPYTTYKLCKKKEIKNEKI